METDAAYLVRNNYQYTAALAAWALKREVRFQKLLLQPMETESKAWMTNLMTLPSCAP